jgi:hypothetical protein
MWKIQRMSELHAPAACLRRRFIRLGCLRGFELIVVALRRQQGLAEGLTEDLLDQLRFLLAPGAEGGPKSSRQCANLTSRAICPS